MHLPASLFGASAFHVICRHFSILPRDATGVHVTMLSSDAPDGMKHCIDAPNVHGFLVSIYRGKSALFVRSVNTANNWSVVWYRINSIIHRHGHSSGTPHTND